MSKTPFMQLYPADYLAKTMDLTTEQHGAYLLLLMSMWTNGAKLPNDPVKLARIARMSPARFKPVWSEIGRYFEVAGAVITNDRLTKERKKADKKSAIRAVAGKAGGEAKALKDKDARLANAMRLPCHSSEARNHIEKKEDTNVSLSAEPTLPLPHFDEIAEAVSAYNRTAEDAGWPKVSVLNKTRRASLKQRLREAGGIEGWMVALGKARAAPHLCGQNDRGWRASFDFIVQQSSFTKIMEGNYDAKQPANGRLSRADATTLAIAVAGRTRRAPDPDFL